MARNQRNNLQFIDNEVTSPNWAGVSESVGDQERDQTIKGNGHTTEEKIRVLREADGVKPILELCPERNIAASWTRGFSILAWSRDNTLHAGHTTSTSNVTLPCESR